MDDDIETIRNTLTELAAAGIPVHPFPRFKFWNLLPPVKNNFLCAADPTNVTEPQKAQLVILSALPKNGVKGKATPSTSYRDFREAYSDSTHRAYSFEPLAVVTDNHSQRGIWAESSFNIGADIVVTRGGSHDEISSDHLVIDPRFKPVVMTHDRFKSQPDAEIPGSLGIVVREGYAQTVADNLNPEHRIGKKLLSYADAPKLQVAQ
jgi:hypothetical protein